MISTPILDPAMGDEDAILGLGKFSHLGVIFHFHRRLGSAAAPPIRSAARRGGVGVPPSATTEGGS